MDASLDDGSYIEFKSLAFGWVWRVAVAYGKHFSTGAGHNAALAQAMCGYYVSGLATQVVNPVTIRVRWCLRVLVYKVFYVICIAWAERCSALNRG